MKRSLAEYNLLIEKLRTSTDLSLDQIVQDRRQIKTQNDAQKKNIDAIFTERSTIDSQTKEMEQLLLQMQQEVERQMNSLDPGKREQYGALKSENASLSEQISHLQQELDSLNESSQRMEEEMKQDPMKQKALGLYDELYKLQKKKSELDGEIQKAQVSLPDERERLLQRVKVTNNDIAILERKTNESLDLINQYKDQIAQMDRDLKESKSDKADKFRELQQRDKEMTQFIDTFEETKQQQMESNTATELTIIALLEHISRGLAAQTNMPTVDALHQMKEDLKYKEQQLENSQTTAEKLRDELQNRQAEFDKMTNLDQKIATEMSALKDKIKSMQGELETYNHIEDLKLDIEDSKRKLTGEKNKLMYRREMIVRQIQVIQTQNDQKKKQLADNDNNTQLEILEKSLRHYEQNNFHMSEYISTKGVESEYAGIAAEVSQLLVDINALCIQDVASSIIDVVLARCFPKERVYFDFSLKILVPFVQSGGWDHVRGSMACK
eukprot:Phypoly_transcript_03841.p1 GENE.Phypoly_transcript_03841~~Phypoly_transcript_03841.p1  ORF type:complete len:573 (-),score=114.28 Phypoly_transcript_03841:617-2107(-)